MTSPSQRCAKMWNGSEMRQLLPYMPDRLCEIITFASTLVTQQYGRRQLRQQNLSRSHANDALHLCNAPPLIVSHPCIFFSVSLRAAMTHLTLMYQHLVFTCADMLMHSHLQGPIGAPLALQHPLWKRDCSSKCVWCVWKFYHGTFIK